MTHNNNSDSGNPLNRFKPLTPGYENAEGPHHEHDAEGNLIIDFTGSDSSSAEFAKASSTESINQRQIDPATGYPKDMIWTTKDGRRIPIPHMQDSHLLNVIAFLRRRVEPVYKKMILREILKSIIRSTAYCMTPLNVFDNLDVEDNTTSYMEDIKAEATSIGKKVLAMDADTFLRTYSPQFPHLYQEAYKRKLLIEVDHSKLGAK